MIRSRVDGVPLPNHILTFDISKLHNLELANQEDYGKIYCYSQVTYKQTLADIRGGVAG